MENICLVTSAAKNEHQPIKLIRAYMTVLCNILGGVCEVNIKRSHPQITEVVLNHVLIS